MEKELLLLKDDLEGNYKSVDGEPLEFWETTALTTSSQNHQIILIKS